MLQEIQLKNFAIIEQLTLDFKSGMTVITGETGAGKSITIDAIELALGARLDGKVVRANEKRCDINLIFDVNSNQDAQQWLSQHELDDSNECIIRRSITQEGRSRCYINGQPITLQLAGELGALLINIHGQHEHQSLLQRDQQLKLLDKYANHQDLVTKVKNLFERWHSIEQEIKKLQHATRDKTTRYEFLQYQLQEFAKLGLQQGELETLELEHKQLANADKITEDYANALNILSEAENHNIISLLTEAQRYLNQINFKSESLENIINLLNNSEIELNEAAAELNELITNTEQNPERLQFIEQRLNSIHDLARKHRVNPEDVYSLQEQLQAEFEQLDKLDETLNQLQQELDNIEKDYFAHAEKLSKSRDKAAKQLNKLVTANLQELNMQGGVFFIEFLKEKAQKPCAHGLEKIEFMVAANQGLPLQALNKVASGGELSRISLALQVILAQKITTPTLIFDEVDVGIGGGTAEIVGKLLRQLGQNAQVICVTHLPQVASQGQYHFKVSKDTKNDKTTTAMQELTSEEKIKEIARMLGGVNITQQTLAVAKEMLELAG